MSKDFVRVSKGLMIGYAATDVGVLRGSGAPGTSADTIAVGAGSLYLEESGILYKKKLVGSGTDKWQEIYDAADIAGLINGISWREPVLVRDNTNYADITAAETAANVGDTVDSITISAGVRILFDNLISGNDNVYIVSGTSGNWTFTEDTNLATDGDALLIQDGTNADEQWVYNGTQWLSISSTNELIYIRNFIGKSAAGSIMPTYTDENFISDGDNLELAIDQIDQELGQNVTDGNFILAANKINDNIQSLDTEIGPNVTDGTVILAANSVNENIQAIDSELEYSHKLSTATGVTTQITLDSFSVTGVNVIEWNVFAFNASNSRYFSQKIMALTNGTNVTIDESLINKLGSGSIQGLEFDVDINAGNIRLLVTSTDSVDVKSKRIVVF